MSNLRGWKEQISSYHQEKLDSSKMWTRPNKVPETVQDLILKLNNPLLTRTIMTLRKVRPRRATKKLRDLPEVHINLNSLQNKCRKIKHISNM